MEALADQIQNFYDHFPLSLGTVIALTACFLLATALLFREFLSWYLRLGRLRAELVGVRQDLALLQIKLDQVLAQNCSQQDAASATQADHQPAARPAAFPLTH